jgi:hypothetical protein
VFLCLKKETELASKSPALNKLDDRQSPPQKTMSVKFSHALLDFLTFEDGAGRLCGNIFNDLPLSAALYPTRDVT